MIAKLETTQGNAYQNEDLTQNPRKQWEVHKAMNRQLLRMVRAIGVWFQCMSALTGS